MARVRHTGLSRRERLVPRPACFFLTGPWEEGEKGRARGAESLSEKKAIRSAQKAVKFISVRAASAWGLPRQECTLSVHRQSAVQSRAGGNSRKAQASQLLSAARRDCQQRAASSPVDSEEKIIVAERELI